MANYVHYPTAEELNYRVALKLAQQNPRCSKCGLRCCTCQRTLEEFRNDGRKKMY